MDDVYLFARSLPDLQSMLNDLVLALASIGLVFNPMKVQWISNKWVCKTGNLQIDGLEIPASATITVLGSVIEGDLSEVEAYDHCIACGWACYHKWARILESKAGLFCRISFWVKTVMQSMLCLQTTRAQDNSGCMARLRHAQRLMFRKMIGNKRKVTQDGVYETWLEWHIRSFRQTAEILRTHDCDILDRLDDLKRRWAGHILRFGLPKGGEASQPRDLKALLFWRPLAWWRHQQWFNDLKWLPIKHPARVGRPRRWEEQFSSNWPSVLVEV